MERLQKLISRAGIASRRTAEKMIAEGRVSVDGQVVTQMGVSVDPVKHRICVDGKPLTKRERLVYFMLYKPRGYISTVKDERGRRTVLELLPDIPERVYPVGRLDGNTEGLLLLTNDGILMNGLLHPRNEIRKTYIAQVEGDVTADAVGHLRRGVRLSDGMTAPAEVHILARDGERGRTQLEIVIHEGRNRQVRRMCEAVGYTVHRLKRIRFASLDLYGLRRGGCRSLTEEEVSFLYELTNFRRQAN